MGVLARILPYLVSLSKDKLIELAAFLAKKLPGWISVSIPKGGFPSVAVAKDWVLKVARNPIAQFLLLDALLEFFGSSDDSGVVSAAREQLSQEFGIDPTTAALMDEKIRDILDRRTGDGQPDTTWGTDTKDTTKMLDDQHKANLLIEGAIRAIGSYHDFVALYTAINTVEFSQIENYGKFFRR